MKPTIAVPAIAALIYRAWSRKSLTPVGLLTAFLTAVVHALHPFSVGFTLLGVFFIAGTAATKVKHDIKAKLTQSSTGASGGEGPRNHIQVLANSVVASVLLLLDTWRLNKEGLLAREDLCWQKGINVLLVGVAANYAATAADTFSSELGILSKSKPRLITAPWRVVPPGTNGGVTPAGLGAGLFGAFIIAATSTLVMPFCKNWNPKDKANFTLAITLAGLCGTLLDSYLGAILQASVVDVHSGKVVEGEGGRKVLVHANPLHFKSAAELRSQVGGNEGRDGVAKTSAVDSPLKGSIRKSRPMQEAGAIGGAVTDGQHESRKVAVGHDILDNNGVNVLMAALVSVGSMLVACVIWDLPFSSIVPI